MTPRSYRLTQLCVYFSVMVFAIVTVFLFLHYGIGSGEDVAGWLVTLMFYPINAFFMWLIVPYILVVIFRFTYFFLKSAKKGVDPRTFISRSFGSHIFKKLKEELADIAIYGVPCGMALILLTIILGRLNAVNAGALEDTRILGWDYFLTGTYPFIALAKIHFPGLFLKAVRFSFSWLPSVLAVFAFYLLRYHRDLFYQFAATFSLSLVILMFLWWHFPVLSPHDRFIDNVYHLAIAPSIKHDLLDYHPPEEIANFLAEMRTIKNKTLKGVYPTSTMPSAHVVWGAMLFYYAWVSDRRLFAILGPFALLSSLGAFILAQHYFVDFPSGVLVAAITILAVYYLAKRDSLEFSELKV